MPLRFGDQAANVAQASTVGPLDHHELARKCWVVPFAHRYDFTPARATGPGAITAPVPEFSRAKWR